ncbi:MAG: hypothetical protein HKM05_02800 [Spirochaetales bacterium]|nr:hypothetical protein [Spirochaetales bacterium]
MPNLYLLFNHQLTDQQKENAYLTLGVENIIDLKPFTGSLWSAIPPGENFPFGELKKIVNILQTETKAGDYILIMGEWGATFYAVDWCLRSGRLPCHTTTSRKIVDEAQANKTEIDVTRRISPDSFRLYQRFTE